MRASRERRIIANPQVHSHGIGSRPSRNRQGTMWGLTRALERRESHVSKNGTRHPR